MGQNYVKQKESGAGNTIAGVILLAIGLSMVIIGGAAGIDPFLNRSSGQYNSFDTLTWIAAIIIFWIGMLPTIFGIRFIAQTNIIHEIDGRIDTLTKHIGEDIKEKHDFQKQLDTLRNDLEEEIKKHQLN